MGNPCGGTPACLTPSQEGAGVSGPLLAIPRGWKNACPRSGVPQAPTRSGGTQGVSRGLGLLLSSCRLQVPPADGLLSALGLPEVWGKNEERKHELNVFVFWDFFPHWLNCNNIYIT